MNEVSHTGPEQPKLRLRTLAVDCGGGGIKASVLDASGTLHAPAVRVPTPYPLPPERLVDTIADIAAQLPPSDRATVGMPGMIRHGVVVALALQGHKYL